MNQIRSIENRLRAKIQSLRAEKPELEKELNQIEFRLNNSLIKSNVSEARTAEQALIDLESGKTYQKQQSTLEQLEALTRAHEAQKFYTKGWKK
jgi:transcriptional regulator of heat shock response